MGPGEINKKDPEKILSVWKECLQGTTIASQSAMTYLRVGICNTRTENRT